MKLELKHLAPYLPYGLFGMIDARRGLFEVKLDSINQYTIETSPRIHGHTYCDLEHFKPILHPLSDLTKDIDVDGERFVPMDVLCNGDFDVLLLTQGVTGRSWIDSQPYHWIQKLIEWHFDVFGLIEAGLAIDVNELDTNPYE
jgi:hypothetical protein